MNVSKIRKLLLKIPSLVLHAIFVGAVLYFVFPILTLYWNQKPAVGIDLFLSVDFATYIHEHFKLPFLSWKYIWYSGTPLAQTYPTLHFYLIQPLLHWFSAVRAVQIYVLFSMALFLVFSYLFYYSLSKSRGLALVLSVATAYSYNLWSALYWAGSMPYIATMFLLPLCLYLVVLAFEKGNPKLIYIGGLLCGLFILAHPQSLISFTVPLVTIFILFYPLAKKNIFGYGKFRTILLFGLIILFVGFPLTGTGIEIFKAFFSVLEKAFTHGAEEIIQSSYAQAAKDTPGSPIARMFDIYKRSNPLFFKAIEIGSYLAIGFSIAALIVRKKASESLRLFVPLFLMFAYFMLFLYAFVLGINPIAGGWFRVFWPVVVILGAAVSVLWRVIFENLQIIAGNWIEKGVFRHASVLIGGALGLLVLAVSIPVLQSTYSNFRDETLKYVEISSAFPTVLSMNLEKNNWPKNLPRLVPAWIDSDDARWRIYDMDATFNIWWSSVFKMPLVRGYLDAGPKGRGAENYQGWQYWQNVTLSKDEAVKSWDIPEELAKEQAKFLIDWNAIKYYEGKQSLQRTYASNISSYIVQDKDIISRSELVTVNGPSVFWNSKGERFYANADQELFYHEISDEYTSPIYMASNAPAILVVGDSVGQDVMMRNLAFLGLGPKRLIVVQWDKPADDINSEDLKNFQAVILYRYKYKNSSKVFSKLARYVKEGGNVFIDTGTEQAESNSLSLPEIFPFDSSERKPLGKVWDLTAGTSDITANIDFGKFGEPIFDGNEWNFAYPTSGLRNDAKVIFSNHNKAVMVDYKLGEGRVIWSGMNFAGHLQSYRSLEETKFFGNLLSSFGDFSKALSIGVNFERPSSEEVIINASGAKAVLFKEAGYSGWSLKMQGNGRTKPVQIFEAGPIVPGYMFAFIPNEMRNGEVRATFKYGGEPVYKITYLISILAFIVTVDLLFFEKRILKLLYRRSAFIHRNFSVWWERED